ncbi:endonuclease/exonuclease/phosphatase family protein [Nonomuraea sp. NPDC050536]|uniref:endonuclease/exonuclease/phosphatase family protein n=1 Tax=Nonomuraea sp. NPDC050536 TaxID=3364366 RepID=UPI0037C6D3A5
MRLRIMTWNILDGGRFGVAALIAAVRADVIVTIETYGLGAEIGAAYGHQGVPITRRPPGEGDNLWLFSRYPIAEAYPEPTGEHLSSFNAGGVRLGLGGGRELDVFPVWLHYLDDLVGELERGRREGLDELDHARHVQIKALLYDYVATHGSPDRPAILAGDFNTVSHLDWGDVVEGRVTREVQQAGFQDVYRSLRPDVLTDPGGSWDVLKRFDGAYRIDYLFTRGAIDPVATWMLGERAPGDPPQDFFSDHAALIADLRIQS